MKFNSPVLKRVYRHIRNMLKSREDFAVRYAPCYTRKRCKSCKKYNNPCVVNPLSKACKDYEKR